MKDIEAGIENTCILAGQMVLVITTFFKCVLCVCVCVFVCVSLCVCVHYNEVWRQALGVTRYYVLTMRAQVINNRDTQTHTHTQFYYFASRQQQIMIP